jgi:hypothetical protein
MTLLVLQQPWLQQQQQQQHKVGMRRTGKATAAATSEWLRLTDDGERKSIQGRQRLAQDCLIKIHPLQSSFF